MRLLFIPLVLGLLLGCSTAPKKMDAKAVNIGDGAMLELKQPKDILPNIKLVQELSVERDGKSHSSQVVVLAKDNHLTIVSLLPFGGEVFRIEYAGNEIQTRSLPASLPKDFDLKYALADMIIMLSPAEKLQTWLSAGSRVVDDGTTRTLFYHDRPIIRITYSEKDHFKAKMTYQHLLRNYQLQVVSLTQGQP